MRDWLDKAKMTVLESPHQQPKWKPALTCDRLVSEPISKIQLLETKANR